MAPLPVGDRCRCRSQKEAPMRDALQS
ncbi:MAG: hypothetical protein H6Q86_3550, partial [candidate division NC10 bacterium]|nr:hypothetical protein [candidate division NC10 bacterium]